MDKKYLVIGAIAVFVIFAPQSIKSSKTTLKPGTVLTNTTRDGIAFVNTQQEVQLRAQLVTETAKAAQYASTLTNIAGEYNKLYAEYQRLAGYNPFSRLADAWGTNFGIYISSNSISFIPGKRPVQYNLTTNVEFNLMDKEYATDFTTTVTNGTLMVTGKKR